MTGTRGTRKTTLSDATANTTQETETSTLAEDLFATGSAVNPQIQSPEFGPVNFTIVEEDTDFDNGHAWLDAVLSSPNRDELALQAVAADVSGQVQPTRAPILPRSGALALAGVALLIGLAFLLF